MNENEETSVLFVGGYGRSGSTLLDLLLGSLDDVIAVGEVRKFWLGINLKDRLCACGTPIHDCGFWSKVYQGIQDCINRDPEEIYELQKSVDRIRYTPQLIYKKMRSREFRDGLAVYMEALDALYKSISNVSGAELIVDSTKDPQYGFILDEIGTIDLRMVHLVRDGRAVANSWRRTKERPDVQGSKPHMPRLKIHASSLRWLLYNGGIEALSRRELRSRRVKYEDLANAPLYTLSTISDLLPEQSSPQEELSHVGGKVQANASHGISGNPIRFDDEPMEISLDDKWKKNMTKIEKTLASMICLPFLIRYGYLELYPQGGWPLLFEF